MTTDIWCGFSYQEKYCDLTKNDKRLAWIDQLNASAACSVKHRLSVYCFQTNNYQSVWISPVLTFLYDDVRQLLLKHFLESTNQAVIKPQSDCWTSSEAKKTSG